MLKRMLIEVLAWATTGGDFCAGSSSLAQSCVSFAWPKGWGIVLGTLLLHPCWDAPTIEHLWGDTEGLSSAARGGYLAASWLNIMGITALMDPSREGSAWDGWPEQIRANREYCWVTWVFYYTENRVLLVFLLCCCFFQQPVTPQQMGNPVKRVITSTLKYACKCSSAQK